MFAIDLPQLTPGIASRERLGPLEQERSPASGEIVDITTEERDTLGFGLYDAEILVAKQWYWWCACYEKSAKAGAGIYRRYGEIDEFV